MHAETSASLRAQAAHARHLADHMHDQEARAEVRQIAEALDAKADALDRKDGLRSGSRLIRALLSVTLYLRSFARRPVGRSECAQSDRR